MVEAETNADAIACASLPSTTTVVDSVINTASNDLYTTAQCDFFEGSRVSRWWLLLYNWIL
ncbi:hypothetical protein E1B28_000068, partial [Marasmius oreades]